MHGKNAFRPAILDGVLSTGSIKILFGLAECEKIISLWQTPEKLFTSETRDGLAL